jgi:Carboxypeptidase regulatory-like domain
MTPYKGRTRGKSRNYARRVLSVAIFLLCLSFTERYVVAQTDQGTITGVVQDQSGAVIPKADVTLTSIGTGLVLRTTSDASGIYNFSPIKIGDYSVSASAPGFETTTQLHVHLDVQQRLNVLLTLNPGAVSQTITVSTAPSLLQTQQGSVGQVVSADAINNTPLNGRNWVYIAQLTAGVAPAVGSRGQGTGDFSANGQQAAQNDFILDGVDNNENSIDYLNGASYVVRPPPDALAEFRLDTSNYSAEFGHSAGAVVNASIKAGTNQIHGDIWEYFRNDALNARDFIALTIPEYRENQFGATLGLPIIRNKLFFFGDVEANRIVSGAPTTLAFVPTALMRQGNFSELSNTSLTGATAPIQLYEPTSGGTAKVSCNGQNNVFCPQQLDAVAQHLFSLFPMPNTNNNKIYNNYTFNQITVSNTWQWDTRMDWNIRPADQMYAHFSYANVPGTVSLPLGPILDGSLHVTCCTARIFADNFMASETHLFNPNLVNEFRFGYSYGYQTYIQPNSTSSTAASDLGLGGVPPASGDGYVHNGGLPLIDVTSIGTTNFGSVGPSIEHQNVYQVLDNVTKIMGSHSLKFGLNLQSIRFSIYATNDPRGFYDFIAHSTSDLGATNTGNGAADFLVDQMDTATVGTGIVQDNARWYRAAYAEDNWRITRSLTVNLGVRYDYYQPYVEAGNRQGNFIPITRAPATGTAVFLLPKSIQNQYPFSPTFQKILTKDNVAVQYTSSRSLVTSQLLNFSPRIGFAYSVDSKTAVHGGFGIFYGGLQSIGGQTLGYNYPFQTAINLPSPSCSPNSCPSNGITLEGGFTNQLAQGLGNSVEDPTMSGAPAQSQTPYTIDYNLGLEYSLSNSIMMSLGYVGNGTRHLQTTNAINIPAALQNPANSQQTVFPFPDFGGSNFVPNNAISAYNALQTKLEKRLVNGLNFLATYTWSHSLDDAPPLLYNARTGYRNALIIPIRDDYSNSPFDVRNRFTFNGFYEIPFGVGRARMNHSGLIDLVAGGWATDLTFAAESGQPITIGPDISTAVGGTARAILRPGISPFAPGGSPDVSNPGVTCPQRTRTLKNWYNPCAFANPLPGANIPRTGVGSQVTDEASAISYLGGPGYQITGPGYNQVSMSLFKDFRTYREQHLQFRTDVFNVLNTPDYGNPSITNNSSTGGEITSERTIQNYTPDARFFQFSLKYVF